MVSTRQMSTSSGTGGGGGGGGGTGVSSASSGGTTNSSNHSSSIEDSNSLRPSVVTRQSNTTIVVNMPSSSSSTTATTSAALTALATSCVRQTQAFKNNKNISSYLTTDGNQKQTPPTINLIDLPEEILYHILSFVSYKKIGNLRAVCHKINDYCMHILNSKFSKLLTKTFNRFQEVKANMPRRESARRNHPLACESDIIETCYMRLSLLQMTFGKHIERGHCCFFPGAILDEVYSILNYIKKTPYLERPYTVTDELFDLSTMAMEYFRDHIESTLPGIAYFDKDYFKLSTTTKRPLVIDSDLNDSPDSLPSPPQSNMVLRKGIRKIKQGMKIYNNQLSVLRNELRTCKRKSSEQGKQIAEQQKLFAEQRKQTLEYANRLDENDKKNEEMSRKFSTLLQELNKCKTELQYWRSKSPAIPNCTSCGHKVTPILPQEDYQALINQGVKPEDIILNLNDDTDPESDRSGNVSGCNNLSKEFVLTDGANTAKLLAVNTATKSLKRQHTITEVAATKTNTTSNTHNIKFLIQNNETIELTEFVDTNEASTSSSAFIATAGYSTRLCYGSSDNTIGTATETSLLPHKSVIVSPQSQLKRNVNNENLKNIGEHYHHHATNDDQTITNVVSPINNATTLVSGGSSGSNNNNNNNVATIEDVTSLQAISSHETKKARRVQKTTRCLTNSSSKRK